MGLRVGVLGAETSPKCVVSLGLAILFVVVVVVLEVREVLLVVSGRGIPDPGWYAKGRIPQSSMGRASHFLC